MRLLTFLLASLLCVSATAATYELPPGEDVIGAEAWTVAAAEDTLVDIARRHGFGYDELQLANPDIDPWLPEEGMRIKLPSRFVLPAAARNGIVINLAEMRLYYFTGNTVMTYPVSVGREGRDTPLMRTRVTRKLINPTWRPTARMRREAEAAGTPLPASVPPGPDNPLGPLALRLGRSSYLIHGTIKPFGIGLEVTSGCLRLYPEDIEELFAAVPVGTPVRIVNQPWKVGWGGDVLHLERHDGAASGLPKALNRLLVKAARQRPDTKIDWHSLEAVLADHGGAPLPVPMIEPINAPAAEAVAAESRRPALKLEPRLRLCGIPTATQALACADREPAG